METKLTWRPGVMLIWLLAAETVNSAPTPTQLQITAFRTLFPPSSAHITELPLPETQGFYPTKLEREGHEWEQPTPPVSKGGFFLDDILDTLNNADTLLNWLLPDLDPVDPAISPSILPASEATSSLDISPYTSTDIPSTSTHATTFHTPFSSHLPASLEIQGSMATMSSQEVFLPVATGPVPAAVKSRNDHPVPKNGITTTKPVQTNKFYAGLFLGSQTNATFTHPYSVSWAKGSGPAKSYGMAISHIQADIVANGPTNSKIPGNPISYYINPIGIQSMILSASELGESTVLTAEDPLPFSANAVFRPQSGASNTLTVPVVQGMGFVTGVYNQLQPLVQSGVQFRNVVVAGSPKAGVFKYRATLEDGSTWLIYVIPDNGQNPGLKLESSTNLRGPTGWSGVIQVAKNQAGSDGEKLYDNSAGVYAVDGSVAGSVTNNVGTYHLSWAKSGKDVNNTPLMMFALSHHFHAFDQNTKNRVTNISLRTTTKGFATAVIGETWTLVEPDLPTQMDFAPWSPSAGSVPTLSAAAKKVILNVATAELQENIDNQTNLNSMYFSGKAFSKFANLIYTVSTLCDEPNKAAPALNSLKQALARFIENRQQFPLVYDTVWKGVVSSASYGGDSGADFGNTYYNDHHFHYGYFIHAAAIIGTLDPSWLPQNKAWVNMLVRDASNPSVNDAYFPFSRGFDWYHGHSWAKGLFESYDGKDQESSSEDTMFAYALKMWGKASGDASMEARGDLMLGILRRSLHNYFLMDSANKIHPSNFIANKVTGILFENKVDHTTYFGANLEYIQGIHMLPILPCSAYIRRQKFVREEWNALFAPQAVNPAQDVTGGWKGVLFGNLALINPVASWNFFAQANFDASWIDGGASRAWYLAYAAGLGGGPN